MAMERANRQAGEVMQNRPDPRAATVPRPLPRSDRALDRTLALWTAPRRFAGFKRFVTRHVSAGDRRPGAVEELGADQVDRLLELLEVDEIDLAQLVGIYLGLPFRLRVEDDQVDFGLLPHRFCERHLVVPLRQPSGRPRFALGNPFHHTLARTFENHHVGVEEADFVIVTPREVGRALSRSFERPELRPTASRAEGHLAIDATQPLEPLHRILSLHTLPRPAVA